MSMKRFMVICALCLGIATPGLSPIGTVVHASSSKHSSKAKGGSKSKPKKGDDSGKPYTNVDGKKKHGPSKNKKNSTYECADGTKSESDHAEGACSGHLGVVR